MIRGNEYRVEIEMIDDEYGDTREYARVRTYSPANAVRLVLDMMGPEWKAIGVFVEVDMTDEGC